jgi:putative nucleotidyltransferase with HDIG domain
MADADFQPVRVNTLRGDIKIPFDIYIKVAGKFIHYCRAGDSFEGVRLGRLKAKKLKELFIRPEDMPPYEQYLEQSIEAAFDSKSNKSLEVRAEVIEGFQETAAEQFMEQPASEVAYNHVRSAVARFVRFLSETPNALQAILKIENPNASITHHSVNVATIAMFMTMNTEHKDSPQLPTLALGALLHDIDHMSSGVDITKPIKQMSKEELADFKEHPMRGAQKLQSVTFPDQLVMNVILQHEEACDGTGFPKGLLEKDIDPLVLYASVANAYDRLVSFNKMSPKDAMKDLLIDKMGLLPLPLLQVLQNILKNAQLI